MVTLSRLSAKDGASSARPHAQKKVTVQIPTRPATSASARKQDQRSPSPDTISSIDSEIEASTIHRSKSTSFLTDSADSPSVEHDQELMALIGNIRDAPHFGELPTITLVRPTTASEPTPTPTEEVPKYNSGDELLKQELNITPISSSAPHLLKRQESRSKLEGFLQSLDEKMDKMSKTQEKLNKIAELENSMKTKAKMMENVKEDLVSINRRLETLTPSKTTRDRPSLPTASLPTTPISPTAFHFNLPNSTSSPTSSNSLSKPNLHLQLPPKQAAPTLSPKKGTGSPASSSRPARSPKLAPITSSPKISSSRSTKSPMKRSASSPNLEALNV